MAKSISFILCLLLSCVCAHAQTGLWHDTMMSLHYRPQGKDFVKVSGTRKFNRALYGTNTAFRVEAGDLPEFALYMPGMGGNLRFAILKNGQAKWLTEATTIQTIYRPGSMLYELRDPMLGNGTIAITVLALAEGEGLILKLSSKNVAPGIALMAVYGGASGKKFSRNGDIGADPESSFYLLPEYAKGNEFQLKENRFTLSYGTKKGSTEHTSHITGIFPAGMNLHLGSALMKEPQSMDTSSFNELPVLVGKKPLAATGESYFLVENSTTISTNISSLPKLFQQAENARKILADRVVVQTPDSFINTLGGALAMAADAIWEDSSYLHGAVAWRMRLNAWRGAYVADPLGWHDRAQKHFSSYALSQVTEPSSGPAVPDTALHFARQAEKMGTSVFSSGYISRNPGGDKRPHHYDMNLVFIDQLLNHFNWSGDTAYVRAMWPLLQRHLAWEKRNFDLDGDGLYDAYACIWASDALQYSGGGVMHSSAYNYRANKSAAELATLIGEDAKPYEQEAAKIYKAIQQKLWMPRQGSFAEYKDLIGNQLIHPQAGAWTVYHTLDAGVPDAFQAWQLLQYADAGIPRIPIAAKGLNDRNLFLTATTNWQPYTWSINNVALAENLHLSLAYWQGNRRETAFQLWKSALVESMYLSASPGGFEQLSFYDAVRGELYRDFADPIGMAGRSLVEGLFGILPDALHDTLLIRPGFPEHWKQAFLKVPDVSLSYKSSGLKDQYQINSSFRKMLQLKLAIPVRNTMVVSVLVNNKPVNYSLIPEVGGPVLQVNAGKRRSYKISVKWGGEPLEKVTKTVAIAAQDAFLFPTKNTNIIGFKDPQQILQDANFTTHLLQGKVGSDTGNYTLFLQLKQGDASWWQPVCIQVLQPLSMVYSPITGKLSITNNSKNNQAGKVFINPGSNEFSLSLSLKSAATISLDIPAEKRILGTNSVRFLTAQDSADTETQFIDWSAKSKLQNTQPVDLKPFFNDKVTNIFKHEYLTPRPSSPTLQLPTQGIGNWCYPLIQPTISDSGFRQLAGTKNQLELARIPFSTPADSTRNNIVFTSQWDNFPDSVSIPLNGKAHHLYLLMAGTTNPMQSQLINGVVSVTYTDGTHSELILKNPETWWPIEQDYMEDGFAFHLTQPVPPRVHLIDGSVHFNIKDASQYTVAKGFSNRIIEGGAATILDLPLDPQKEMKSMTVKAVANDVIIGLISATLIR